LTHVLALIAEGFGQFGDGGIRIGGDAAQRVSGLTAHAFVFVAQRLDHVRRGALCLRADPAECPNGIEPCVVVGGLEHLRERRHGIFADLAEGDRGIEAQVFIVGFEGGDELRHRRRRRRAEIRQAHDRLHPGLRVRAVQLLHQLVEDNFRVAFGRFLRPRERCCTKANHGGEAQ
jgi:hypothetical protein